MAKKAALWGSIVGSNVDYDYHGAVKAGVKPGPDAHWPDTYKLPNHVTFSTDSKYSDKETPGGRWRQKGKKWFYKPSPYVKKQQGAYLKKYFDTVNNDGVNYLED